MKILFVTAIFNNEANGAARFAKLIYLNGGRNFYIMTEDANPGNRIIPIKAQPKFYERKLWQYFRLRHYRAMLERHRDEFDVFVFNHPSLAYGFETNKPCFVFVHDAKRMKIVKTFRFDYFRKHLMRRIEKKVLESRVQIISNSRHISKRLTESYSIQENRISLLYQGIRMDNKVKNHDRRMDKSKIRILFVKNDYITGGLFDLNAALQSLKGLSFECTIVGTTRLKKVHLQSPASHIDYNILGIQDNDAVVDLMYSHDILCIPSHFEPLGVAVMEGLAVGIPTITTGVGGLAEVTDGGRYIWQCKRSNPLSIAEQILACITNEKERREKTQGGRIYVREKFDFSDVLKRFMRILKPN